jgi:hypothetical protein
MIWIESPVSKDVAKQLLSRGCTPVKMLLGENGPVRLAVIVSRDPGPTGLETHASVSASTAGVRRTVTTQEVEIVKEQLGMRMLFGTVSGDGLVYRMWLSN